MKKISLTLIRFYQHYLSLDTGIPHRLLPHVKVCRFTPTCSEYTYQAIKRYGIIAGMYRGVRRILRCHPWNEGGYDPLK